MEMDIFIVNREAGSGKSLKYLKALEEIYNSSLYNYKVIMTYDESDTVKKAMYYSTLPAVRYIFSIGGDGTLNRVVNGMCLSNKPLVVIPAGSGNDFYQGIKDLQEDTLIDLGRVNNEYFLGVLSIGIDALACNIANEVKKENIVGNPYAKGAIEAIKRYESMLLKLESDNIQLKKRVALASFCNNSCFGKGINIAPNASLTDGLLDLIVLNDASKMRLVYTFIKLMMARHENDKNISFYKTQNANLEFSHPILYAFDGEERYGSEIDVSIEPRKLLIKRDLDPRINKLCK